MQWTWLLVLAGPQPGPVDHVVPLPTPVPAVREGVPAALYVETDGLLIQPCPRENASLLCSTLVPGITVFPAWGTMAERATALQVLSGYYEDLAMEVVTEPLPPYVPHMLAVVGGTSSLIGQETTSCGLASLVCGGERRNLVSFTFAASCGGWEDPVTVASIIAQESAHNLGLEHVSASDDIMFPTLSQVDQAFRDVCNEQLTAGYDDQYLCPEVHMLDCPDVGFQNSYAELLRVLGPRWPTPPALDIVELSPASGTVLEEGSSFQVSASIDVPHEGVGLRWTYLEGPELPTLAPGLTRCTNDVCDEGYDPWPDLDAPFPFATVIDPPAGTYRFRLELADVFGTEVTEEIHVIVGDDTGTESDGATSGESGGSAADGGDGCSCSVRSPARAGVPWLLVPVSLRRRRRPRCRGRDTDSRPDPR